MIKGKHRYSTPPFDKNGCSRVFFSIEAQFYFMKRLNSVANESCVIEVLNVSCINLIWPHVHQQMGLKMSSPVET